MRHFSDEMRGIGRRTSVGGAMGLMPARKTKRKAKSTVEVAAARLDKLNAEDQQPVGKHTRSSSKVRKSKGKEHATVKGHADASSYQAKSRKSMLLYQNTERMFSEEKGEYKNEAYLDDMPALDGDDESENSTPDNQAEEAESSVIATPGPPPKPTKSDEEFIAPEGTPVGDPDYELTEEDTEGMDGDDEGEGKLDGGLMKPTGKRPSGLQPGR